MSKQLHMHRETSSCETLHVFTSYLIDCESSLLWLLLPDRLDRGGEVSGEGVSAPLRSPCASQPSWCCQVEAPGQGGTESSCSLRLHHTEPQVETSVVCCGRIPSIKQTGCERWMQNICMGNSR